ncbi:reverse transcriptase [Gossypium australe]|uniref:Reverse transcriptase n=1 Tax=Gossypium australe TaxID=47621 RepID=A0A5B6UF59_9ROSI|nr:reverse transcriptase [Gossypium australe]
MERIRCRSGFVNGIDVGAEGSRGGLCLAWKEEFRVSLKTFSKNHVDVQVEDSNGQGDWRFTGFYGSPYVKDQHESWRLLRVLGQEQQYPWLGVANEEWMQRFPQGTVRHLVHSISDHCPLLINTGYGDMLMRRSYFKFEAWWTLEESFEEELKKAWESLTGTISEKLRGLQTYLSRWASLIRGGRERSKKEFIKELGILLEGERTDNTLGKIIETRINLNLEIDKEEMYWEQRARANWLSLGDKNSAFFHKYASARRRINMITKLETEEGMEVTSDVEVSDTATRYFQELFTSNGVGDSHILDGIDASISAVANVVLQSPYSVDEIQKALKEMGPTKAPDYDGFPALFFQKYWHIVGKDVEEFCLGVLNEGKALDSVNRTDIVLILKTPNPSSLVNFRPISLCTILYKLVAKTIANRLQDFIGTCIDRAQSAFVPGRLISDNVLIAYEILHSLRQKRLGKKGFMAVKLDMSKAYDRVEWSYLEKVMLKMGFDENWVKLIMKCISTVSYTVNINRKRGRVFSPSRGLRQGDPLSPYLFLICSEGLSALIRQAVEVGNIRGVKASRRGPEISHLLFADDCLLFGEATKERAYFLKEILQQYKRCSGQCVNFNKSTIFYSSNTLAEIKRETSKVLGMRCSTNIERYLGLLNIVGKRKKESFQHLKEKVNQKICQWSSRFLSQGGKEVFIKSVLQAIPAYTMSCFLLPKTLCGELESMFAKYWWQHGKDKRGIHWCQWDFMSKDVLRKGLVWRMGIGNSISVNTDAWIPEAYNFKLLSQVESMRDCCVNLLIDNNLCKWKEELVRYTFAEKDAARILRIPLASNPHEDFRAWGGEASGEFSVRSAYKLLQCTEDNPRAYALQTSYRKVYKKLRLLNLPTKIKLTIWKITWNFLPTRANLQRRRLLADPSCPKCGERAETVDHLFRECPATVEVWSELQFREEIISDNRDFEQWLIWVFEQVNLHQCRIFCCALWAIWGDWNWRIHNKKVSTGAEIGNFIINYLAEIDDSVKINVDGAFDSHNNISASGVVVRDNEGSVLLSWSKIHKGVHSAFEAEAVACREAVQIGVEHGWPKIIIEGDSLTIIKKCQNQDRDRSMLGAYIQDIQMMVSSSRKFVFKHVPRLANILAHSIATQALRRSGGAYQGRSGPEQTEYQRLRETLREPD